MLHLVLIVLLSLLGLSNAGCPASYAAAYDLSSSRTLTSLSLAFADGGGKYWLQPCGVVAASLCPNSPGQQQCFSKTTWDLISDDLGSNEKAEWSPLDGDWAKGAVSVNKDIAYNYDQCSANEDTNNVKIVYMCDKGDDSMTVISEPLPDKTGPCVFEFKVDSSLVCAGGSVVETNKGGLSKGWIFVIILVVVSFVYVAGGMSFNRFRQGKSGTEMVPNLVFWKELPSLVKDGCSYFVTKCKGLCGVKSAASTAAYDIIL